MFFSKVFNKMPCLVIDGIIHRQLNQIAVKQLKNRYNDPTINKRFVIGIDRAKMRLFDIKVSEQTDLVDSGQEDFLDPVVFDNTDIGEGWKV